MYFAEHSAAISPDGTRVVFAQGAGLYVVDAEGGRPVRLRPQLSEMNAPTFSPDGSQIAYLLDEDDNEWHVWVVDADGGNAHEILADEPTVFEGITGLQWSPAGDRLAIGVGASRGSDAPAIYTFARRLGLHGGDHQWDLAVLVTGRIPDRVHNPSRSSDR
jgi:Tol biopolymer transport system component